MLSTSYTTAVVYLLSGITLGRSLRSNDTWSLATFKSHVNFGDSFSDEGRLSWIIDHNFTLPPVGFFHSQNNDCSTGGRIWPRYVAQYTGTNTYNYAVSGSVCSNNITPRKYQSILFPSVAEYEIPAYLADVNYVDASGKKVMDIPSNETVYSIWIGTNDMGNEAFLTDSQVKNKTIVDYLDCVYAQLDILYQHGARYFVIQNLVPLQLLPQYALPEMGGVTSSRFFPDKGNVTADYYRILEQVVLANDAYKTRTALYAKVTGRYPGAKLAMFNVYDLFWDIYYHPAGYLNGTAPANVTGFLNQPAGNGQYKDAPSRDSFMWHDELHPSEQTDRIVAREFINVVKGTSKWADYYTG